MQKKGGGIRGSFRGTGAREDVDYGTRATTRRGE